MAEFFDRAVSITLDIKTKTGAKVKDFKAALENGPGQFTDLSNLAADVKKFANNFPAIGQI